MITINSFGVELTKDERAKLYPRCGRLFPDGLQQLAKAEEYEQVRMVAESYSVSFYFTWLISDFSGQLILELKKTGVQAIVWEYWHECGRQDDRGQVLWTGGQNELECIHASVRLWRLLFTAQVEGAGEPKYYLDFGVCGAEAQVKDWQLYSDHVEHERESGMKEQKKLLRLKLIILIFCCLFSRFIYPLFNFQLEK